MTRSSGLLLVVAVAAMSLAAPLVRVADAPALAIAFWRLALASAVLAPVSRLQPTGRPGTLGPRDRWLSVAAGALLAAHFATWIPSLSLTTVAASVTLVTTQPLWTALWFRLTRRHVARGVWIGIGTALTGVVILSGVDLSVSAGALGGDALALAGAGFGAAYVILGADIRQRASTTAYTAICYPTAALLLLATCLVAWQPLAGYPATTWLALAGLSVGPQLLGHSLANRVVREAGPTIISVAILGEIVGASLLAAIWFGEVPPAGTIPAAGLIGAGIVTVIRAEAAR